MITPYYEWQNFFLYHDDCLTVLNDLEADSVDLIFADPPYFLSNGTFTCHAGRAVSVKKGDWDMGEDVRRNFEFHLTWIKACKRVLKPNGTIWINGNFHSIYPFGYALQLADYHILNDIVWFKPDAPPNPTCRYFTASHETLIWAKKDRKAKHTFNYDLAKHGDWLEDQIKRKDKQMRSVWSIITTKSGNKKLGKKLLQKPYDLVRRIILLTTNKGDLIFNPFCENGATQLAASKLERGFISIDMAKWFIVKEKV